MLPENITAIVARNETWTGDAATEPYETGWAKELIIFVRALKTPVGLQPEAIVEISPDGIHWVAEGSIVQLPGRKDELGVVKVIHFGSWVRIRTRLEDAASTTVLVTFHLKA